MINNVRLNLKPLQFVAIYALLGDVRLGDRNVYESAISDLMIEMEELGSEELMNAILDQENIDAPSVMAECSTADGLTLNLV